MNSSVKKVMNCFVELGLVDEEVKSCMFSKIAWWLCEFLWFEWYKNNQLCNSFDVIAQLKTLVKDAWTWKYTNQWIKLCVWVETDVIDKHVFATTQKHLIVFSWVWRLGAIFELLWWCSGVCVPTVVINPDNVGLIAWHTKHMHVAISDLSERRKLLRTFNTPERRIFVWWTKMMID